MKKLWLNWVKLSSIWDWTLLQSIGIIWMNKKHCWQIQMPPTTIITSPFKRPQAVLNLLMPLFTKPKLIYQSPNCHHQPYLIHLKIVCFYPGWVGWGRRTVGVVIIHYMANSVWLKLPTTTELGENLIFINHEFIASVDFNTQLDVLNGFNLITWFWSLMIIIQGGGELSQASLKLGLALK